MSLRERHYADGFKDGPGSRTPITAAALNSIDEAARDAAHQYEVVANAAARPTAVLPGQMVYRQDTSQLEVFSGIWQSAAIQGSVIQTVHARSDTRTTYSASASGNGTTVAALNLTITPRYEHSWIACSWMINGEMHQDATFLVHRGGSLVTDIDTDLYPSGWPQVAGYNAITGNVLRSGLMNAFYDRNEDSTPSNWQLLWVDSLPGSGSRTYAPAVRGTGSNYTLALNRTLNGSTGDNYESMVSIGVAMEIRRINDGGLL